MDKITIGVLTVSDRCAKKEAIDESGDNLVKMIKNGIIKDGIVTETDLVPDNREDIETKLLKWSDDGLDVILTTGGTGVSERDNTPEASAAVFEKVLPGISWLMLKLSLEVTPLAALSRALAGVRGKCLIVNLPGSKKASQECLEAIADVIPHAVDLISGRNEKVQRVHASLQNKKSSVIVGNIADRKRDSPYPMVSVEEAQKLTMKRLGLFRLETMLSYKKAHGHVLAEDVVATDDLPPFDASLKDGYAVLSSDRTLEREVVGASTAGGPLTSPKVVKVLPGNCMSVSTGAAVPHGADAVIQVEDTEILERDLHNDELKIKLKKFAQKGQDIRPRGSDFKMGQLLLTSGTYLDSSAVGVLAAAGITSVKVYKKPSVAIISTGDELTNPEEDLKPGKVRDSNRIALISLLKEEDVQAEDLGIVPDEADALLNALERAFRVADVVVTTGSMSMGERDYLKEVLVSDFNADIFFGRVNMKPGKPTSFAVLVFEGIPKLWFGLPGNPASAFVSSQLFLLPALRKICGMENVFPLSVSAALDDLPELDDRPQYARGILKYESFGWTATHTGNQRSSRVGSCVNANCLLELPSKSELLEKPFDEFGYKQSFPIRAKYTVKAFLIGNKLLRA